jgi:hypothetical protein
MKRTTGAGELSRKLLTTLIITAFVSTTSMAQTVINQGGYDSKSLVDTNSTSVSTSTINTNNVNSGTTTSNNNTVLSGGTTNVNTNNNINSGTMTNNNNNNNVMSGSVTYTNNNNNVNSGTQTFNNNNVNTGDMTNRNINTSTSTSVNTNNNVNTGDMTNRNINTSTATSNNTNTNINSGTMTNNNNNVNTGTMTNNNNNVNSSTSANQNVNQNINSGDMTNRNINDTNITQKIIQPPPTAVAPAMMSGGNADLCSTGTSGSVQTQIFGVSSGGTVRDMNCERLKLSKTLYDMGMKVAAVATMCQDRRVFDAMMAAGTPCPYEGQIGLQAKTSWEANPDKIPQIDEVKSDDTYKKIGIGALLGALVFKIF